MRVLVADDDRSISTLIRRVLAEDGYAIDVANTGEEARMLAFVNDYDAIILDVDLGDRHGFEILQEMRTAGKLSPVLLYTGHANAESVVRGLDAGADGYIVKPVPNQELKARVRSLIRRGPGERAAEYLSLGDLRLNRLTRKVTNGSSAMDLTPVELKLLEYLMARAGQTVTRSELHDKVWDIHFSPSSNMVDAHIARLRKKLTAMTPSVLLETRRGLGFVLTAVDPAPELIHAKAGKPVAAGS